MTLGVSDALATNDPVPAIETAIAEATDQIEAKIEQVEATEEDHWKALADQVADAVYDKAKKLITDLLEAAEDAAEIATEAIEAPVAEAEQEAPTEEELEQEEDVKPRRSHPLFRKPMKKKDE